MRAPAFLVAASLLIPVLSAHGLELEGYPVPETVTVANKNLMLNGAAIRRFAIFKVEVASLYLVSRQSTLKAVTDQPGPKRLQLIMLRDVRSDDLAKKFMSDFKSNSEPAEWKSLINEIATLGGMFSSTGLKKGDVLTMDSVPGTGLTISRNGKPMSDAPLANELVFNIILRIFLGPNASEDARLKLLGQIKPTD